MFQRNQRAWQERILVVLLPGQEPDIIPLDMARVNRFSVDPDDLDSFDLLLRAITAQPKFVMPELGEVPALPPTVIEDLSAKRGGAADSEYGQYVALRKTVEKQRLEKDQGGDYAALLQALLEAIIE